MAFDGTLKFDTAIDKSGLESGISGLADKAKSVAGGALSGLGNLAASAMQATTAAVTAATGAVAALGTKAIASGKEFEAGMSQVQATLGLSISDVRDNVNGAADTMAALTAKAEEMGATTAFTAAQAADGLNILAMSGYDAETSIDMIGNVLSLAAAGGLSLGDAASFTAGAMKGFAAEASQFADATEASGHYADMIAKGATLAATDVYNLGAALSDAAASASAYGQSSTETEVALLRLAEQGVTGTAASTALAAAMQNLYAGTDQAKTALEELGVDVYDKQTGKVRDFNAVVDDLGTALARIDDDSVRADLETTIFGKQGKDAFDKMVVSSADTVQKFYDGLANSDGSAGMQAEVMLDNLEGDMTLLESAADGLYNSLYKSLNDPLRDLAQTGSGYLSTLTKAFSVGGFQGLAGALGGVLSQAVTKLSGMLPEVIEIGAQVIESLVSGLVNNLPKMLESAQSILSTLVESFSTLLPELIAAGAMIMEALGAAVVDNVPMVLEAFKGVILQITGMLSDPEGMAALVDGVNSIVSAIAGFLTDPEILAGLGEGALSLLMTIGQVITENLPLLIDTASQLIADFALFLAEHAPELLDAAIGILEVLISSILDNLPMLIQAAIELITSLGVYIGEHATDLVLTALEVLQVIIDTIIDNLPMLLEAAVQIIQALCEGLSDDTADILIAVKNVIMTLVEMFRDPEMLKAVWQAGMEIIKALLPAAADMVGSIAAFVVDFQRSLTDAIFNVDWAELGLAILNGILSGLMGDDIDLAGVFGDFADNWLTGIKDVFGIASPSKLMKREVGRYLAQGVGVGFTEEMPEVSQDAAVSAVSAFRRVRDETMGAVEAFRAAAPSITGGRDVSPSALGSVVNNYYSSRTVQQQTVQQGGSPERSGDIIIPVQIGNEQVETVVVRAAQIANARSGGVTI